MRCRATVILEGFETVCGAPDTVKVCPFGNLSGCIVAKTIGTALNDAEEGETVEVQLSEGFLSAAVERAIANRPVVSEFLDSLTPEERKGAMKLLRKIQEVVFG